MIEVLVTIVICVIGLWGLTEVQARLQMSEMESYQRSQALMLAGRHGDPARAQPRCCRFLSH